MKTLVNTVKLLNAYKAKVVLMTFLVTSFTLPAYTQEILWHELIGKANTLHQQRRYPEAESVYKEALKVAEDTFGSDHSNVAISLKNLAELYYNQGRYAEAEPLYKSSLEILEEVLGPDHPEVATILEHMAVLVSVEAMIVSGSFQNHHFNGNPYFCLHQY